MKYILAICCWFLVAMSADPTAKTTISVQRKVANLLVAVTEIAEDATGHLTNEAMKYYLKRETQLKQVINYLRDINKLREIAATCVAARDEKISETINNMFYDTAICDAKAENALAINATVAKIFFEPKNESQDCAIKAADAAINELVDIRESIYACCKEN